MTFNNKNKIFQLVVRAYISRERGRENMGFPGNKSLAWNAQWWAGRSEVTRDEEGVGPGAEALFGAVHPSGS